jgi:spore coat protein A
VITNDANAPFPDGDPVIQGQTDRLILFKVTKPLSSRDRSTVPATLPAAAPIDPRQSVQTRDLVMTELDSADPFANPIIGLINAPWADPVTETPRAGSTEIWRFINATGDEHPKHVHLVQFNILDRQKFSQSTFDATGKVVFTDDDNNGAKTQPIPAPPDEKNAPKDVLKAPPTYVTRIASTFTLPKGTTVRRGQKFRYVLHCHILEHEDNDMMRPWDAVG